MKVICKLALLIVFWRFAGDCAMLRVGKYSFPRCQYSLGVYPLLLSEGTSCSPPDERKGGHAGLLKAVLVLSGRHRYYRPGYSGT